MSKLFFYYSTMNAGKSTNLLQASYNYQERGFETLLFTFHKDNRSFNKGNNEEQNDKLFISSRLGIKEEALGFDSTLDFKLLFEVVSSMINENKTLSEAYQLYLQKINSKDFINEEVIKNILSIIFSKINTRFGAIFVDEAQFLTEKQVKDLAWIVDHFNIPVLCYGLRTDFLGNVFEGSKWLLGWSDELIEMKTICPTGKKATFVLRLDSNGTPILKGEQVVIGGNDKYLSVSRKIHQESLENGFLKII